MAVIILKKGFTLEALSVPSVTHQHCNAVRYFVSRSKEDEGCFRAVSRLQSQSSVIAVNSLMVVYWLTSVHLHRQQKKKPGIVSWPVSRPHLGRLLDSPANQPGADMLHMACNLFCYYHPRPASVSNSNAFLTALCWCSFVSRRPFSVSTHSGLFKWLQLLPADFYQLTLVLNNNICSVSCQECKERWDTGVDQTLV